MKADPRPQGSAATGPLFSFPSHCQEPGDKAICRVLLSCGQAWMGTIPTLHLPAETPRSAPDWGTASPLPYMLREWVEQTVYDKYMCGSPVSMAELLLISESLFLLPKLWHPV